MAEREKTDKRSLIHEEKEASRTYKFAARKNPKAASTLRHIGKQERHHASELRKAKFSSGGS